VRRERLMQEKNGMALPDETHLSNLRMQLEEKQASLEEASMYLEEAQEQLPRLEEERRTAQELVSKETSANAQLEARLSALKQLQESVQTQARSSPGWKSTAWPNCRACGRSCTSNPAGKPRWKRCCASACRPGNVEPGLGQGLLRRCAAGQAGAVRPNAGRPSRKRSRSPA
jgi:hypothetical protein